MPVRPAPTRRFLAGRNLKIIIVVLVALLATSGYFIVRSSLGPQQREVIIDWQVLVFAGSYNATHFTTPLASNIEAKGSFTAVGGNGDILVWIVSDTDYQTYVVVGSSPPASTTYYNSGTVHSGNFDVHLPPGGGLSGAGFWIVFTDNFYEGRAVTASGFLYY